MAEYWAPSFRYPATSGTVLTLTRTMGFPDERAPTIGGFRESASGTARAARLISRRHVIDLTLRLAETERAAVRAFIMWAQDNPMTGFDFWPSPHITSEVVCYLVAPVTGEDVTFPRSQELTSDLETRISIRKVSGAAFDLVWHPD